jgi:hypothetical protein
MPPPERWTNEVGDVKCRCGGSHCRSRAPAKLVNIRSYSSKVSKIKHVRAFIRLDAAPGAEFGGYLIRLTLLSPPARGFAGLKHHLLNLIQAYGV